MITLRNLCQSEPIEIARSNFIDAFNADPTVEMIEDSILDLDLSAAQKAFLAGTVDELCSIHHVPRPDWIFDSQVYLNEPQFSMNAKGALRLILLQESPKWYRSRNLFVSANCSRRV